MTKLSDRLFTLRVEHGLTQEALCDALEERYGYKTTKGMISKYEKAIHEPNVTFINHASDLFGVNMDYLLGRSDNKYGDDVKYKEVPILGTIAAGIPILAQEDIQGCEYIKPDIDIDFCLKVKGDSMINARIHDGDVVFIKAQPEVENGQIAAVQIDDESATLKRVYYIDGTLILRSENPNYQDMIFSKKDRKKVIILGKAICFKSEVK